MFLEVGITRLQLLQEIFHLFVRSLLPQGTPEYATILAFDVKIDSEARKHAEETSVRIFTADIIYHLFDQFTAYMDRLMEQRRQEARNLAVFPCIVKASCNRSIVLLN